METDKPFDVLIIGSGIGGLSMGIILSLLHFRVAIIEKNPLPGGLMRSYQRDGLDLPRRDPLFRFLRGGRIAPEDVRLSGRHG